MGKILFYKKLLECYAMKSKKKFQNIPEVYYGQNMHIFWIANNSEPEFHQLSYYI